VCFASFLSDGFTTMAVKNPPERKLAKCTSLQWSNLSMPVYLPWAEHRIQLKKFHFALALFRTDL
jgi:hypothetical protein